MPRFWITPLPAIRQSGLDRDRSGLPTQSDFIAQISCAVSTENKLLYGLRCYFNAMFLSLWGIAVACPHSKALPCLWRRWPESNRLVRESLRSRTTDLHRHKGRLLRTCRLPGRLLLFHPDLSELRRSGRYLRRPDLGIRLAKLKRAAQAHPRWESNPRIGSSRPRTDRCATEVYMWRLDPHTAL